METQNTAAIRPWRRIILSSILGAAVCASLKVVLLVFYALCIIWTDHDYRDFVDRWLGKPNPTSRSSTIDLSDGVILMVIPFAGFFTGLLPGVVAGVLGSRLRSFWAAAAAGGIVGLIGVAHAIILVLFHTNWEFTRGVFAVGLIGLLAGTAAGLVGRFTAMRLG